MTNLIGRAIDFGYFFHNCPTIKYDGPGIVKFNGRGNTLLIAQAWSSDKKD